MNMLQLMSVYFYKNQKNLRNKQFNFIVNLKLSI